MKYETTINYKELKKLMKLSITIDVKLSFDIAYSGDSIAVERLHNWDATKTKFYKFADNELKDITRLINAYTLYNQRLTLH